MKTLLLGLVVLGAIALVAIIHDMNMKTRHSLTTSLAIGIRDKATGEGVETGIGQTGERSYAPTGWINMGAWIKTAKMERVAISFDVISTTNDQPASIMAHYAIDRAGVITKVDLPLLVADMTTVDLPVPVQVSDKMRAKWLWVKLDDRLQTIAYLTNGGTVGF